MARAASTFIAGCAMPSGGLMLLPHRAQSAAAEHALLVDAIQRRDSGAAEEAARQHVRAAQRERLKRLFPDSPV